MDTLYTTILNFLNTFFPTAIASTWGNLNELISYFLTWGMIYQFTIKPLMYILGFMPWNKKNK